MKYFIIAVLSLILVSCAHKVAIKKDTCECAGDTCICEEE